MINYKLGDVVLVEFGFSEGIGFKKRPALIISSDDYHKNRQEVVIMAITSNTRKILFGDSILADWKKAGLIYPSLVAGIIRTIKSNMIIHRLGHISKYDLENVQKNLKKTIGIS